MIDDVKARGLVITAEMECDRALSALELSDALRMTALSAMSSKTNPHCPEQLGIIARRLFQTQVAAGEISRHHPGAGGNADHTVDREDTAYVAQPEGGRRNIPGSEKAAISNTRRRMNFPNNEKGQRKGRRARMRRIVGYVEAMTTSQEIPTCHFSRF